MTYNVFSGTLNPTHSLTHSALSAPAFWICAPTAYNSVSDNCEWEKL